MSGADTTGYEQRGQCWYKRAEPSKDPRQPRSCEGCETECLMRKLQRFCTAACANKAQFGKDVVSYGGAHDRVQYQRGSACDHRCVDCGQPAAEWSYNGGDPDERADASGRLYSMDPAYYVARCLSCHRSLDTKRGEEHHAAILTERDVREIHELYASTLHLGRRHPDRWTHRKLGELFGVDSTTIGYVLRGRLWAHLELPPIRWAA